MSQMQSKMGSSLLFGPLSISNENGELSQSYNSYFCCFRMFPDVRCTDLVVHKVYFMNVALEIIKGKTFRIQNWQGNRTFT
jgi:hypothetical protein